MDSVLPGAPKVWQWFSQGSDDPAQGVSPAWAPSVSQSMTKEAEALQTCLRLVQQKLIYQGP